MVCWLDSLLPPLAAELEAGLAVELEGGLGWWLWTGALAFGGDCSCALQGDGLAEPCVGRFDAAALCFGTSGDAIGFAFAGASSSSSCVCCKTDSWTCAGHKLDLALSAANSG